MFDFNNILRHWRRVTSMLESLNFIDINTPYLCVFNERWRRQKQWINCGFCLNYSPLQIFTLPLNHLISNVEFFLLWGCSVERVIRNAFICCAGSGSSGDSCDEIYCGARPFSEKESLALARYLYKVRRSLVAFIDVHTYGQLWMSPWGYTTVESRHYSRHEKALEVIKDALQVKQNITYEVGTSSRALCRLYLP